MSALPLGGAMSQLVVKESGEAALVGPLIGDPLFTSRPALIAGLWLYVDQLDASHRVSQELDDSTGAFWHGIMHRREGDFSNAHYWFRRVGHHPAMKLIADYDAHAFIDEVEAAHRRGLAPAALVERQRREWAGLFAWCAAR